MECSVEDLEGSVWNFSKMWKSFYNLDLSRRCLDSAVILSLLLILHSKEM
jgi:hypothetical protein